MVVLTAKDMTADDQLRLQGNVRKVFQKASFSRDELIEEIRSAIEPRTGGPRGVAGELAGEITSWARRASAV